jgi:hypothetical protein
MLVTAVSGWFVCEMILPLSMVDERETVNCILCLGGRLLFCTLISIIIFWLVWHRSKRYGIAAEWVKKMVRI